MSSGNGNGKSMFSCKTASETLEWINAVIEFIEPYRFLIDAHVVNFFKDGLWEAVPKDWMDCLSKDPIQNLLSIPSGLVHDHWPASLKEFVLTLKSLSFPRHQANLFQEFPGLDMTSLNNVLAQGMNRKKKHEIEAVAAVVSSVARNIGSTRVVDVGAGQGYLAQVLSFQHGLSVYAIDACLHHGKVTDARAERVRKYYASKMRKSGLESRELSIPKTVTCQVLSANMLNNLSSSFIQGEHAKKPNVVSEIMSEQREGPHESELPSTSDVFCSSSLILAGLHACGDLSVTMLRTFLESDQVKSVISIGCCYNLLSEDDSDKASSVCGFPMSKGVKFTGFALGRSARDLACQSAERWKCLGEFAGLHNFELHAFRAAFQMVLSQYYPKLLMESPSLGRQGKALRRQQHQKILESNLSYEEPKFFSASSSTNISKEGSRFAFACIESRDTEKKGSCCDIDGLSCESFGESSMNEETSSFDRFSLFLEFCHSGLNRLGLHYLSDKELHKVWEETEPFSVLIGPYWSLRAALGPVLETIILLDRLLFLQEQGSIVEAVMLPIFDPVLSPRNVALIAKKRTTPV
ncbi:protein RRNAD1 isoform X2 [Coffea eugenioides]|uniref:protein RRNAD1 isoform X2 n=1 Tax=Coffea eugenioides TaxID=49369 RepID=UPI000F60D3B0|nr:protein RRNAD1 isoform X2 [Coffea eugenioides]